MVCYGDEASYGKKELKVRSLVYSFPEMHVSFKLHILQCTYHVSTIPGFFYMGGGGGGGGKGAIPPPPPPLEVGLDQ